MYGPNHTKAVYRQDNMSHVDIGLMAHLLRRAGFGATREEMGSRLVKGYEATVEELVHPEDAAPADQHILLRYYPSVLSAGSVSPMAKVHWMYHMLNTGRPLQEKMALFWHHVFATGNSKLDAHESMLEQIAMFRLHGMGSYRNLMIELAKNPAMIFWLDQNENHKYAVNENWGRELLELFTMGVGNYTETDVKEASRAFTGWTIAPKIPRIPYGRYLWKFEYKPEDHDNGEKTFLGYTGRFNGEDIIDIIVKQPACARFIARHIYNFFVADEPPVPSWSIEAPQDPGAIDWLAAVLTESNYELRPVLHALFNSDFFKAARFTKVKSPVEVVVGTLKLVGGHSFPSPGVGDLSKQSTYMGQDLLNPPSVEGWHSGPEWVTTSTLMSRINFMAEKIGDLSLPGVQAILQQVRDQGTLSPDEFVDSALDLLGPLGNMDPETRQELVAQAQEKGILSWKTEDEAASSTKRVVEMLQLIVGTPQYQFA